MARAAIAAEKAVVQPAPAAAQAADKAVIVVANNESSEHLTEEADVVSTLPIQAEQDRLPPLPVQDELCPEYCESVAVCDATVSAFGARQSEYEIKTDAQFEALEHQLEFLCGILKQKTSLPQPTIKYPCNLCGQTFETERACRNHVRTHQTN